MFRREIHGNLIPESRGKLVAVNSRIVLDLSSVTYVDSAGLGAIFALWTAGQSRCCALEIVNLTTRGQKLIYKAATSLGYKDHFYQRTTPMSDDHQPFIKVGIPSADIIDFDYGPDNAYWHTPQDSIDKLAPQSFEIVGNVVLGTIAELDQQ